ncbi:MAG: dihydrolipoyl dehydrogenase [Gammaproteobacteria bacterium]|nr:dihydrolipoyl dehydrogenase [Gammaproteobacteria bacterium]
MERKVDIAIIGAGSAGLFALPEVRKATENFVLINAGPHGTTCARAGCMPSKALIRAADDFHRRKFFHAIGIHGGDGLKIDIPAVLRHVRTLRDSFVRKTINGSGVDTLGDRRIDDFAEFAGPDCLKAGNQYIRAKKIILATGSKAVVPDAWKAFQDQILTTDALFEQEDLPASMAVAGLGAIGLEIGQALHRLGVQVTGFDLLSSIAGIKDPEVNLSAIEIIGKEFPLHLGKPVELKKHNGKLTASNGEHSVTADKVLAALGRVPNLAGMGLEHLGVKTDARGVPEFNRNTMQIGDLPIFIAGDAAGERVLLHEAADEGRIAGFNAIRAEAAAFRRKPKLNIAFCDPNIVSVGAGWAELGGDNTVTGKKDFQFQGRPLVMGEAHGLLHVYGRKSDGKILGAEMAIPRGEHLGHYLACAIYQGLTAFDLIKMPYYHPVIEEGLQNALYDLARQVTQQPEEGILELDSVNRNFISDEKSDTGANNAGHT